jgi:allantoinase
MNDMVITGPVAGEEPVITYVPFPNGARIAVNFSLALEAWSPGGVGVSALGDHGAISKEAYERGVRDWATISSQEYGGRVGIWRILRVLEKHGVVASCSTSGYVAERWPAVLKALTEAGHEIVAHGYYQDVMQNPLGEEEDLEAVTRTTEALEAASGQRPVGWSSTAARRGNYTLQSMFKNDYLYTGDFREADVPFMVARCGDKKIYAAPRTDEINDITLQRIHGGAPSVFVDYFKRTFDQLYEEGDTQPAVITSVFHGIVAGRPWGGTVLSECIQYAKQFPDVWICTRRAVIENYVAQSEGIHA